MQAARSPTPPKESQYRAVRARQQFVELQRDRALLPQLPPGLLSARLLYAAPLYTFDIAMLDRQTSISNASRLVSWMYLLQYEGKAAALEVMRNNGRYRYVRLHQGSVFDGVLRFIRKVKRSRRREARDTHLRFARVDALYLLSLWLHD